MSCASSAGKRQNAFGSCATDLRLIRYSYTGTYATLPGREGDECLARNGVGCPADHSGPRRNGLEWPANASTSPKTLIHHGSSQPQDVADPPQRDGRVQVHDDGRSRVMARSEVEHQ